MRSTQQEKKHVSINIIKIYLFSQSEHLSMVPFSIKTTINYKSLTYLNINCTNGILHVGLRYTVTWQELSGQVKNFLWKQLVMHYRLQLRKRLFCTPCSSHQQFHFGLGILNEEMLSLEGSLPSALLFCMIAELSIN